MTYHMEMGDSIKLRWSATAEYFAKMDMPVSSMGYYAVLSLNGNEVARWKLNKLEQMTVFGDRYNPKLTDEEVRIGRQVDKDGLAEFIASKLGDLLGRILLTD